MHYKVTGEELEKVNGGIEYKEKQVGIPVDAIVYQPGHDSIIKTDKELKSTFTKPDSLKSI